MVDPESSLLSLAAVPFLGEIPYIEDLEAKRASLVNVLEQKLDLASLDAVLPPR